GGLVGAVAELVQVRYLLQAGPQVGELGVYVALFAVQGHRGSGKSQPFGVLGWGLSRHEDGVLTDTVGLHAALDQVDVQVDEPAHLDPAAEGDLSVALGEVQVTDGEARPRDVHRVEHAGPSGEVLDVLVSAVLPGWGRPGRFRRRPVEGFAAQSSQDRVLWFGRQCQWWYPIGVGRDQVTFSTVPAGEQFRGRGRGHQSRVGDAGEGDPGDVP